MKALFLVALFFVASCTSFHSKNVDREELYNKIKLASVAIQVRDSNGRNRGGGSGTIVATDGANIKVLTAQHVIEAMDIADPKTNKKLFTLWIKYGPEVVLAKRWGPARKENSRSNSETDYGFLRAQLTTPHIAMPIAKRAPHLGEQVYYNPFYPWRTHVIISGIIGNISDNNALMLIDASASPGCSGSAVFNEEGRIIGVVVAVMVQEVGFTRDKVTVPGTCLVVVIARL